MKKTKLIVIAALLIVLSLGALGCGGKYTAIAPDGKPFSYTNLEEYYTAPAVYDYLIEQLDAAMESYSSVYSDYSVDFSGNTITYSYNFVDGVDAEAIKANLESQDMSAQLEQAASQIEQETKIKPEQVIYIYNDVNGNEIYKVASDLAVTE